MKRGRRKKSEDTQGLSLAMLGITLNAIYGSLAIFFGPHWNLSQPETKLLSESLDTALKTLPTQHYELIVKYIESFAPWIGLAIVAGSITIPRYEKTAELRRQQTEGILVDASEKFGVRSDNVVSNSINSPAVDFPSSLGAD